MAAILYAYLKVGIFISSGVGIYSHFQTKTQPLRLGSAIVLTFLWPVIVFHALVREARP
jgi:ethanolamine transporter EutH